jgi:hypothetical protein
MYWSYRQDEVLLESIGFTAGKILLGKGLGLKIVQGRLVSARIYHCM